jgi:hypothetical protein
MQFGRLRRLAISRWGLLIMGLRQHWTFERLLPAAPTFLIYASPVALFACGTFL